MKLQDQSRRTCQTRKRLDGGYKREAVAFCCDVGSDAFSHARAVYGRKHACVICTVLCPQE